MLKLQYVTHEERQTILNEHSDLKLLEEQNITEGEFLIFSDTPIPDPVVYVSVSEEDFENLKKEGTLLKAQSSVLSTRADLLRMLLQKWPIRFTNDPAS